MDKVADRRKPCQVPWATLSPVVQEALRLGGEIHSIIPGPGVVQAPGPRAKLPPGHRFFRDELREQEARILEWLVRKHQGNAWFLTLTFKDWIHEARAARIAKDFLGRLGQAHNEVPGAAPLKSVVATEWQRRDVIHYHLLIFGNKLGSLSRKRWEFRWQMMSGGFAANYDAEVKAAPYLVKHQIKDRPGGNLHLGGSWRGIIPPRSVSYCSSPSNGFRGVATAFDQASVATALEK